MLSQISYDFDVKCQPIKRECDGWNSKDFSKYNKFICGRNVNYREKSNDESYDYFMRGSGIFSPYLFLREKLFEYYSYWDNDWHEINYDYANRCLVLHFSDNPSLVIDFLIPKSSISNYSNFTIKNKY